MDLSPRVVETLRKFGVGRRSWDDPFLENKPPRRLGVYDLDDENLCHEFVPMPCTVPGCGFTACTVQQHASHYDLAHRYSCSTCRKSLPSPHLLDLHVQEKHDSFFAVAAMKKPSYCCYTEECKEKFWNADDRFKHCVQTHKLPKDFRLERTASGNKKNRKNKSEQMEIRKADRGNTRDTASNSEGNSTIGPKAPKHFSFGHGRNKTSYKSGNKKCPSIDNEEPQVDMEVTVCDVKDGLPE